MDCSSIANNRPASSTGTVAPPQTSRFLTVPEVAILFRCCQEKIKRQARRGQLPAFKFGKVWLFPRPEIEAMVRRRMRLATASAVPFTTAGASDAATPADEGPGSALPAPGAHAAREIALPWSRSGLRRSRKE